MICFLVAFFVKFGGESKGGLFYDFKGLYVDDFGGIDSKF